MSEPISIPFARDGELDYEDIPSRSEPGKVHRVIFHPGGLMECPCLGYAYNMRCAHIAEALRRRGLKLP